MCFTCDRRVHKIKCVYFCCVGYKYRVRIIVTVVPVNDSHIVVVKLLAVMYGTIFHLIVYNQNC